MPDLTILRLVANNTLSASMGAALCAAAHARLSFAVVAEPRFAGKSTLMNAVLNLVPDDIPRKRLDGSEEQMRRLEDEERGGYLVVEEIGQAEQPGYIWGEAVRTLFEALTAGYSLATALHADDIAETFDVLCRENGLSDDAASRVNLVLHLRRFGESHESFWRRLAEIIEVEGVSSGAPTSRLLFRWLESSDSFEAVEQSRLLRADAGQLDALASAMGDLVRSGRTGREGVADLVGRLAAGN